MNSETGPARRWLPVPQRAGRQPQTPGPDQDPAERAGRRGVVHLPGQQAGLRPQRQTRPARQRRRRHRSRIPFRRAGCRGRDLPVHPGPRREPHRRRVQRARRIGGGRAVPGRRLHRRPDRPAAAPAGADRRPVRRHRHDGPPAPGPPGPGRDRRQPARGAAVQRGRRTHDLPVNGHAQPHHHRRLSSSTRPPG